jgi:catechol 2,3-dioxygenase-like lactoylglutathione lyase family enzyme
MNWKVRTPDDGSKVVLDIGDFGGVVFRGGLVVPPPPAAPPAPPPAGDSAGAGGRGGRGGRGGGGRGAAPRVVWDGFCWGIEPWDARKVEAELKKRGLDPIADNDGKDFQSFHVKDPDGFDVQISNGNTRNRRRGAATGALPAPAPFEPTNWKTVWLDHISFQVSSYKASSAFYHALLGWTPTGDEGSLNELLIGDVGNILIRGGNELDPNFGQGGQGGRGGGGAPARRARMDHVSFGLAPWDTDGVKAELDKRGLSGSPDTGGKGDIHLESNRYKSYHTNTVGGYNLQISNCTKATRLVR